MAFCTECGANVPDGIQFCIECGKPMGEAAPPPQPMAAVPQPPPRPMAPPPPMQPTYASPPAYAPPPQPRPMQPMQPAYAMADAPPTDPRYTVMGVGSYILFGILFGLPIIGFIACLVTAFASKNLNRRNYARAVLIFLIIGLVISILLYFVFSWVAQAVMDYVNEAVGAATTDIGGLTDLLSLLGK